MTDAEREALIEKMATAIWKEAGRFDKFLAVFQARAALSIAEPIIRAEALEEAKAACTGEYLTEPEAYDMAVRDCIAAVDALKSKGQKP